MYFFEAFMTFQSALKFAELKKNKQQNLKPQIKQTQKCLTKPPTTNNKYHPKSPPEQQQQQQNSQQKLPTQRKSGMTYFFTCIYTVRSGIFFQSYQVSCLVLPKLDWKSAAEK